MAKGYYLVRGDKTTCGGKIIEGATDHTLFGKAIARERDKVSCGVTQKNYAIAGGIATDSIHGRRMAGTLDSYSTCPCRARFVPSMLMDTYEKGGGGSASSCSHDGPMAALQDPAKKLRTDDKPVHNCNHTAGAIKVAEYILNEIKTNVRSSTAEIIRNLIDEETLKQRRAEWNKLPWYAKLAPPPQPDLVAAMALWYQTVKTGSTWDHKQVIRCLFKSVAVARPLKSKRLSESYYHKYKVHDFFLDVWSNIHYGYVGLSVGFSQELLLKGSTWEQSMTPGTIGGDTLDDITSMEIGFLLYHRYGKYAEGLTCQSILDALSNALFSEPSNSRKTHWCWDEKNLDRIEMPLGIK